MAGRVLFGAHREPDRQYAFAARDRCDETVFRLRTVRDAQYRYIRNFTPDQPFLQPNRYKEKVVSGLEPDQATACRRQAKPDSGRAGPTDDAAGRVVRSASRSSRDAQPGRFVRTPRGVGMPAERARSKWLVDSDDQGRFPEPASSVSK